MAIEKSTAAAPSNDQEAIAALVPLAIQQRFNQAVPLIQEALAILRSTQDLAAPDSEAEMRCHEAIQELEGAVMTIEAGEAPGSLS